MVAVVAGVVEAVASVAAVFPAGVPAAAGSVAEALVVGVLAVEASEAGVVLPAAAAFEVVFSVPDVVLEGLLERTGVSAFCVS